VSIPFYCKELSRVCRKVIDQQDYQFQPCFKACAQLVWWEATDWRKQRRRGLWGAVQGLALHLRERREMQVTLGIGMQLFGKEMHLHRKWCRRPES
jgi:hypothetical protein